MSERQPLTTPTNNELRMVGCVHPAAGRRVTGSSRDFTLDRVKFRVVCWGNLEIGLESDTQVGLLAMLFFLQLRSSLLKKLAKFFQIGTIIV